MDDKHGTKRKSEDDDETSNQAAKRQCVDSFSISDFRRCLAFYLVERYQAAPETVDGVTDYTLETHGTCPHPVNPAYATFKAWAVLYLAESAMKAAASSHELFHVKTLVIICKEYVETKDSLALKMGAGLALLKTRHRALWYHDIVRGYRMSDDYTKGILPAYWARPVLAHAKYDPPGRHRCCTDVAPVPMPQFSPLQMMITSTTKVHENILSHDLRVEKDDDKSVFFFNAGCGNMWSWEPLSAAEVRSACAPKLLADGYIPLWDNSSDTAVHLPAPGTYPGISEKLAVIAKTVKACSYTAREHVTAHVFRCHSFHLYRSTLTTVTWGSLHPDSAVTPAEERLLIDAHLAVRREFNHVYNLIELRNSALYGIYRPDV